MAKENPNKENKEMSSQIEEWKKEHGDVFRILVTDPENEKKVYTCYVKKPSKNVMASAAPFLQTDPVKAGDILRNSCYLSGDPEINAKEECEMAVNLKMFELFKIATAEVEKL